MPDRQTILAGLIGVLATGAAAMAGPRGENDTIKPSTGAAASQPAPAPGGSATAWAGCTDPSVAIDGSISPAIEPAAIFEQLVKRYKGLHLYRDTTRLVQVTSREGQETSRIETEIGCEVRDGDLKVQTPATQARASIGLDLPVRQSPAAEAAHRGYDLWLAPHMALKFADEPLKNFRSGVDEGFTATEADSVTIDDKKMLHVELRSGDGLSESCTAKFDLFINPETMLVERIDGEQRMPDGASCTTSVHITPTEFEVEPAQQQ
jgi:hypothetical protein